MKLIVFGPPGAGKGTYSSRIAQKLGIVTISTGEIFRDEIAKSTPLGKKIERYVSSGSLVPDDIVIEVLKKRISQPDARNGFILDGFPRTLAQAEALDRMTKIDAVINLIAPTELLVEKISSRRICRRCGEIYNIANIDRTIDGVRFILPTLAPRREGVCDKCGGELYQREDDRPEVVRERLKVYAKESKPVIDYYRDKAPFINVVTSKAADLMAEEITRRIRSLFPEEAKR